MYPFWVFNFATVNIIQDQALKVNVVVFAAKNITRTCVRVFCNNSVTFIVLGKIKGGKLVAYRPHITLLKSIRLCGIRIQGTSRTVVTRPTCRLLPRRGCVRKLHIRICSLYYLNSCCQNPYRADSDPNYAYEFLTP